MGGRLAVERWKCRLLFFLSPVFYYARPRGDHEGIIPEQYLFYYDLNPLARLLDAYRDALLWGRPPTNETLLYLVGTSALVLTLGFWLFSRAEGRFAKYL